MNKPLNKLLIGIICASSLIIIEGCGKQNINTSNERNFEDQNFLASTSSNSSEMIYVNPIVKELFTQNPPVDKKEKTVIRKKSNIKEVKQNIGKSISGKIHKKIIKEISGKSSKTGGDRSQVLAFILGLFFGLIGVHRFYLGYTGAGVLQLLTAGGCGLWALIDLIRIITGDLKPKNGNYK